MAVETTCSGCGQTLSVADENAGRQARCPACGQIYTVPFPSSMAEQSPDARSSAFEAGVGEDGGVAPGLAETMPGTGSNVSSDRSDAGSGTIEQFWMQTADGNQYGPVDRPNLNRWFGEGRVGPGYKIRQGETGLWQNADLFRPQAANPYASSPAPRPSVGSIGRYAKPDPSGLVLTMGILAWACLFLCPFIGWIPGLIAWITGRSALRDISNGIADPTNVSAVQVGYYLGMIHVVIVMLMVIAFMGFVGLAMIADGL